MGRADRNRQRSTGPGEQVRRDGADDGIGLLLGVAGLQDFIQIVDPLDLRFAPLQLLRMGHHVGVETGQLLFTLLLLAHIVGDQNQAGCVVLAVAVEGGVAQQMGERARRVRDRQRILHDDPPGERLAMACTGQLRIGEAAGELASDELLANGPGDAEERLVRVRNAAAAVDRDQGVGASFHQAAVVLRQIRTGHRRCVWGNRFGHGVPRRRPARAPGSCGPRLRTGSHCPAGPWSCRRQSARANRWFPTGSYSRFYLSMRL